MMDLHPQGARHAVIWLHGLGDSGAGLAPLVEALALPADLPVRHLLPDAPERPITINMGYKMRGWYDIKSFEDPADRAVESHVRESADRIAALLDRLVAEGFAPSISCWPASPRAGSLPPSPRCAIKQSWRACSACPPIWRRPSNWSRR
jgi:hypothetical protein